MKTDKQFKGVMLDIFKNNEKKFENVTPTKDQIYEAIRAEVEKRSKEVLVEMLTDLMTEVGEGDPHTEFERFGTELAAEMEKEENER